MSRSTEAQGARRKARGAALAICLSFALTSAQARVQFPNVGRPATADEIAAWDIDVRPDFKGLPPGSGSVARGAAIWDGKCASCHGTFAESNEVFPPIVGGTTADDIRTGHAKALAAGGEARTTIMKLANISTLWDYVRRAMPWNAPKSLSTDEVYAVVAYILNLADIVPGDFVLSDKSMAEVQARLPNRNGLMRDHGLGTVAGAPDVRNAACMQECPATGAIASSLPDYAKDAHGDLSAQNRLVGGTRGGSAGNDGGKPAAPLSGAKLADQNGCFACHAVDRQVVGPAFKDVAKRYRGQPGAGAKLAAKVRDGGNGSWGPVMMPPHPDLGEAQLAALVKWVLSAGI